MKDFKKKEREDIFKLFLHNQKLKFSDIEKALGLRSNMVAYHIEKLVEEEVLEKNQEYYQLSSQAEKFLPFYSPESTFLLPIILVAVRCEDKYLLIKRKKRPYKNYWSMIGGKIKIGESLEDASLRLVKTKANIEGEFVEHRAILQEHVKEGEKVKHSFLLMFTELSVKEQKQIISESGELQWFTLEELKSLTIIPSDKYLLENKLNESVSFTKLEMQEKDGEIISSSFFN